MSSAEPSTPSDFEAQEASDRDRDFAEVPDDLWTKVTRAPSFSAIAGENQENIFRQQYFEAARQYYADATDVNAQGRTILKLFLRWADVAGEWTRFVLDGDADQPLDATLDWDPQGAGQAMVRPIRTDTFANASYVQSIGSTGQFNLVPDQSQGNAATETATANEQAWMIFGWADPLVGNEVPYDYVQANIDDEIGVRREEFLLWQMEGKDTLKVAERSRGPLLVPPGFTIDIDVNVKSANIDLSLWPIGIEIIRADATEFGGVLG